MSATIETDPEDAAAGLIIQAAEALEEAAQLLAAAGSCFTQADRFSDCGFVAGVALSVQGIVKGLSGAVTISEPAPTPVGPSLLVPSNVVPFGKPKVEPVSGVFA